MDEDPGLRRIAREVFLGALAARPEALPPWVLDRLTALIVEQDVAAGQRIFSAGDPVEFVYFLRGGRVQMASPGRPSWTFEGRAILGVQDVLLDRAHTRTAIAVSDLHLLAVPADAWTELLEDSFELTRASIIGATAAVALLEEQVGWTDATVDPPIAHLARLPKRRLNRVERLSVLIDVPILSRAGVQTLVDLAAIADEVAFEPGHKVLERGGPRDRAFLVLEGIVEASRAAPDVVRRFGAGTLVCGAAAFGAPSLAWQATAKTATRALSFQAEGWFDLMEEHFDIARAVLVGRALERERLLDELATRDPQIVFSR
jgi:CRP-like cAMP-binding protein